MKYLYGDSSPSPIQINFIDFLRDFVDISIPILQAEARISQGREKVTAIRGAEGKEIALLEDMASCVKYALEHAAPGKAESSASRCSAVIIKAAREAVDAEIDRVKKSFGSRSAKHDAQNQTEHQACFAAVEGLLLKHDLPGTSAEFRMKLQPDGRYSANARGAAKYAVRWRVDLEIPADNVFAKAVRLDRIVPAFELQLPQAGGWLKREGVRPQRLEKNYISDLRLGGEGETSQISIRAGADGSGLGYDLQVWNSSAKAVVTPIDAAGKSGSPFDLEKSDVPRLVELINSLTEATSDLFWSRRALKEISIDNKPLEEHEQPSILIERLITDIAPAVQEVAKHSKDPAELVLKRLLEGGRREEIFITKAELKEKLDVLPPDKRKLFDPLGLAADAAGAGSPPG